MDLAKRKCTACHGEMPILSQSETNRYLDELSHWQIEKGKFLSKTFSCENFADSLALANRIGEIAEEQRHHPDLLVRWGELGIKIWTHAVDGLTENDFILAAKIDHLTAEMKPGEARRRSLS